MRSSQGAIVLVHDHMRQDNLSTDQQLIWLSALLTEYENVCIGLKLFEHFTIFTHTLSHLIHYLFQPETLQYQIHSILESKKVPRIELSVPLLSLTCTKVAISAFFTLLLIRMRASVIYRCYAGFSPQITSALSNPREK